MSLRSILASLPAQLALLSAAYATEARRHETLAPYPTLPCLLGHLHRPGNRSSEERKELIAMLLRVHQTRPHAIWSTVLLHVFTPLARKVRKGLQGGDADTKDEIILEELIQALRCVRSDDAPRVFMYVRQALRQRAFAALKEISAWEEIGFGTEADQEPDPRTLAEPSLVGVWLKGRRACPERTELLATLADRGGLQDIVDRRYAGLDRVAKARAFRCLQKQRQRLVAELREQLEANPSVRKAPVRGERTG